MARTEQYTVDQVIRAIENGHTAQGAGKLLGCTGEAIRGYAKRYKSIDRALRAERKNLRDAAQNSMLAAVYRGEGWAVMGVFKTFDEDGEFIPPNKTNLDVEQHGDLTIHIVYDNTRTDDSST